MHSPQNVPQAEHNPAWVPLGPTDAALPLPHLDLLRITAAPLFRAAVIESMHNPQLSGPDSLRTLHALMPEPSRYGYRCPLDALAAMVPRSNTLSWYAWSNETYSVRGFLLTLTVRPLALMLYGVHIGIQSVDKSALPFTETGYKSLHVRLQDVIGLRTPHAFIESLFPGEPFQTDLF